MVHLVYISYICL